MLKKRFPEGITIAHHYNINVKVIESVGGEPLITWQFQVVFARPHEDAVFEAEIRANQMSGMNVKWFKEDKQLHERQLMAGSSSYDRQGDKYQMKYLMKQKVLLIPPLNLNERFQTKTLSVPKLKSEIRLASVIFALENFLNSHAWGRAPRRPVSFFSSRTLLTNRR